MRKTFKAGALLLWQVQTNIVVFKLRDNIKWTVEGLIGALQERGVLVIPFRSIHCPVTCCCSCCVFIWKVLHCSL